MELSICCVVKNDTFYLEMMLKSVEKFADEIIVVDDKPNANKELCKQFSNVKYYPLEFGMNFGKARQYANDKATGDFIFWLDADEVIHENCDVKAIAKKINESKIDSAHVEYIHFINDFGHIDNSESLHMGIYRLHKNYGNKIKFERMNHALPTYNWEYTAIIPNIKIWHLGYLRGMGKIRERFKRNFDCSEIHNPLQQIRWRDWHYLGDYPKKRINPQLIPQIIKDTYYMELGGH